MKAENELIRFETSTAHMIRKAVARPDRKGIRNNKIVLLRVQAAGERYISSPYVLTIF